VAIEEVWEQCFRCGPCHLVGETGEEGSQQESHDSQIHGAVNMVMSPAGLRMTVLSRPSSNLPDPTQPVSCSYELVESRLLEQRVGCETEKWSVYNKDAIMYL
jgi:hypothetical protein